MTFPYFRLLPLVALIALFVCGCGGGGNSGSDGQSNSTPIRQSSSSQSSNNSSNTQDEDSTSNVPSCSQVQAVIRNNDAYLERIEEQISDIDAQIQSTDSGIIRASLLNNKFRYQDLRDTTLAKNSQYRQILNQGACK